jgi:hypothetical protein
LLNKNFNWQDMPAVWNTLESKTSNLIWLNAYLVEFVDIVGRIFYKEQLILYYD